MQIELRQSEVFRALGDPTRRALYERLIAGEETVSALTARFAVSQPAISQHLKTLREAGLVAVRREGREAHYSAGPEGLKPLFDWMAHYEKFWRSRDARLKATLKEIDP
ncbi:MAG TPA: metalloregulator ArsR/SmtB family transcription factor [Rhizomicrobium sp.]|nr:metalloregulator ArsR/SmtB family transcription factor [Rhizomicrobium sp.]